jgi:hypothetical protein
MLSRQEEERERRETLENDRKALEAERQRILREGSTFHQHAQSAANDEAGGRFAAVSPTTVVGAEPAMKYPQLPSSSPWSGAQPEPGIEPPLGFENPAIETSAVTLGAEQLGAPVAEALSADDDVETSTGAPPSSHQDEEGSR